MFLLLGVPYLKLGDVSKIEDLPTIALEMVPLSRSGLNS